MVDEGEGAKYLIKNRTYRVTHRRRHEGRLCGGGIVWVTSDCPLRITSVCDDGLCKQIVVKNIQDKVI